MQTFLPYADYFRSAEALDNKRLGKQRVEVLQLLKGQFPNHPASKMWRGYESSLVDYGRAVCKVWITKGYNDTCLAKIEEIAKQNNWDSAFADPPWLGDSDFHFRHRCRLFDKNPEFYQGFAYDGPRLNYLWPVLNDPFYSLVEI